MRSVTYSMAMSLDSYVVGPDGSFDWTTPDEEVFNLATDEVRGLGVHLPGSGGRWQSVLSPMRAPRES